MRTITRRFKDNVPWLFPALLLALGGCARDMPPSAAKAALVEALDWFTPVPIGAPFEGNPWIAYVKIVDRDRLREVLP